MVVSPYLLPHLGGVERYVFGLVRALATQQGYRVVVVGTRLRGHDTSATERLFSDLPDVRVHWLDARLAWSNTPLGWGWRRRLRQIVDEEQVDLVNAHAPVPLLADLAARAAGGRPFVLTYHSGPLRKSRRVLDALLFFYERLLLSGTLSRSVAVICASDYVAETLLARRWIQPEIIPPAVDTTVFHPGSEASRTASRVLFVGSLHRSARYKGLDDLLTATAALVDGGVPVSLEVVGDGHLKGEYVAKARRLGLEGVATFRGALVGRELTQAFQQATVLALPSTFDNFPTVVLEAMACGTPVVGTDVGNVAGLLSAAGCGHVVPPSRPDVLAERLEQVLRSPEEAAGMGQRGLEYVRARLTVAAQARQTARIFETALESPRAVRRVAVVTPRYPPDVGGVENYAAHCVSALSASGRYEPVVISTNPHRRTTTENGDGTLIVRLGTWARLSNTPVNPLWFWQLRRLFRDLRIDVVTAHSPVPYLADVAAVAAGRRPMALTFHSGSLLKGHGLVDVLLRVYESEVLPRVFARCQELVAVSPIATTYSTGRARLISPGVDTRRFAPAQTEALRHTSILFVGRVEHSSEWKGLHVLLEALPEVATAVPDVVLDVVGSGDALDSMRARAEALGIGDRVVWHGSVAHEATASFYREAGVLVLPSLTEAESFGMTLVEAMACGCPVVGSRVGGIPFVVDEGVNGLLAPPGDRAALARACVEVLTTPELARRLGAAGRSAAVQQWDWSAKSEEIVRLVDDLVGDGVRAQPAPSSLPRMRPWQSRRDDAARRSRN